MIDLSTLPDITFLDKPEILRCVFHPRKTEPVETIPERRLPFSLVVEDGISIGGIIFIAEKKAPNIIFFHGNGEVASDYINFGPFFIDYDMNLAVVDFRGYGTSGGVPTYSAMIKDAHVVFHKLIEHLKEIGLEGPVFVMGRSLGSASALEIAACYPSQILGLIVESGFAHTYNLLVRLGVDPDILNPALEASVSNLEKMKNVEIPVLFIHGERDVIIPVGDCLDLLEATKNENKGILVIPGAGHNTLMLVGLKNYMEACVCFIDWAKKYRANRSKFS